MGAVKEHPGGSKVVPGFLGSSVIALRDDSSSYSAMSFDSTLGPVSIFFYEHSLVVSSESKGTPPRVGEVFFMFAIIDKAVTFLLFTPAKASASLPSGDLDVPYYASSPLASL